MIWLTWRQFRAQAVLGYAAVTALAVLLAATAAELLHLYRTSGTDFLTRLQGNGTDGTLYLIGSLSLLAAPALLGAFWGAPLVARELDAGTHRLVWNQSVTRTRWLAAKLGLVGLAAMAATGLLSLVVTWWSSPIDTAVGRATSSLFPVGFYFPRLSPVVFDARGVVPVAYTAFAFALGVTAGVLLRRIVPALALTLAVCATVQFAVAQWIRPLLLTPRHLSVAITPRNLLNFSDGGMTVAVDRPGAWVSSEQFTTASGHPVPVPSWVSTCLPAPGRINGSCFARLTAYRELASYQPLDRFWHFQWLESSLLLALAVALAAFSAWWIRRRLT